MFSLSKPQKAVGKTVPIANLAAIVGRLRSPLVRQNRTVMLLVQVFADVADF